MYKYLLTTLTAFIFLAPPAFAAVGKVNMANVQCRFADQSGMKLTISLTKVKSFVGHTMLSQSWGDASRPIRKMSLLTTGQKYNAQVKSRKGQMLASQSVPVSLVRIFRQEKQDAINSVIEAYIPADSVLRANNPRISKAYVITTASMLFTDGAASNLKGVCWK